MNKLSVKYLTILTAGIISTLPVNTTHADETSGITPKVLLSFTGDDGDYPGGTQLMPPVTGKTEGISEGYVYGATGYFEGSTTPRIYRFSPDDITTYTSAEFTYEETASSLLLSLLEDDSGNFYTSISKFNFTVRGWYEGQVAKINGDTLAWEFISDLPQVTDTSAISFTAPEGEQAMDAEGNIYFPAIDPDGSSSLTVDNLIIRMDAETGAYTTVRDFSTYLVDDEATSSYEITSIIFSETDNALYTILGPGHSGTKGAILIKIPVATITDDAASPTEILYTMDFSVNGYPDKETSNQSTLLEDDDFIYGTTYKGENSDESSAEGTIWRFNKTTAEFSVIHYFGIDDSDGSSPYGSLVSGDDGNIYGTTDYGGANSQGTLYRINVGSSSDRSDDSYELLHSFTTAEGSRPVGLTAGSAGILYGAARAEGANGYGSVFEVEYPLPEMSFSTDLTASTTSAETGDTMTLSWAVDNAGTCTASGDNGDVWTGEQSASGTEIEIILTTAGTNTFTLTCDTPYDGGESVSQSVTVEVVATEEDDETEDTDDTSSSSSSSSGAFNPLLFLPLGLLLALTRRRKFT